MTMGLAAHGIGLVEVLVLTMASFATSFVTAAFGLGGGVLMLGILAMVLPPAAVIPVHAVVQLGSNAGRALLMRRDVVRNLALPFLLGSALGAFAGGLLVVNLPPAVWQTALGLFIVWSAWARLPALTGRGALAAAGTVSTFLSMFFGATGPMVAAVLKTHRLDRVAHVATHALVMTGQHLLKAAAFGFLGFAFGAFLPLLVLMIAAGVLGTWVGRRVLARRDDARFHFVLSLILTLLGVRLVWLGLHDWLATAG